MPFEQVAEFQILTEHVKALVPAEPLQFCRMDTAIHACGERAAFEAVAAEIASAKTGGHGARLDDLRHGLRADRLGADPGQGRGLVCCRRPRAWREPDPPENRPFGETSGLLPRLQRMHRAEFGIAVGQGDRHGVGLLALGLRQGQPDAAVGPLKVVEADRRQLGAPQRAGESDQKDGAIA